MPVDKLEIIVAKAIREWVAEHDDGALGHLEPHLMELSTFVVIAINTADEIRRPN